MRDLTDSYCERCGARYVFRANPTKGPSLKGARVLAKGLRNFVLTDGQSMTEAMTLARNDDEREDAARMTEAFHLTFNFCMTCRQYACEKCWNAEVGACLSCAPSSGREPTAPTEHLIVRTPVTRPDTDWPGGIDLAEIAQGSSPEGTQRTPPGSSWPTQDFLPPKPVPSPGPRRGTSERHPESAPQPDQSLWSAESAGDLGLLTEGQAAPMSPMARPDHLVGLGPETSETALTPEELQVVQDQLGHAGGYESPGPILPWQVVDHALTSPAQAPVEHPRPVGLPEPIDPSTQVVPHQHVPVIGRLLGHGAPAAELPHEKRPRSPLRDGDQALEPWPHATPWTARQIAAQDWWGDATTEPQPVPAEPVAWPKPEFESVPEPVTAAQAIQLPAGSKGESETFAEPEPAPQAARLAPPAQEPLFDLPPATFDRWPTPKPGPLVNPTSHETRSEPVAEPWNMNLPATTPRAADGGPIPGRPEGAGSRPIGATWRAADPISTPWPGPPVIEVPSAALLAAQQATQPSAAGVWAASAQEVLSRGGGRACFHCALPVSTHARFCRRCGTQQI